MSYTKADNELAEMTRKSNAHVLMLYNDDVNTFDYVIALLTELCGHTTEQAEQCAYLVHYKGKCDIKRGTMKQLKPIHAALGDRGLSVNIEK